MLDQVAMPRPQTFQPSLVESVRATWTGVIGIDAGPLSRGDAVTAHVASLLTVRDGKIVDQETFDCYAPFPPSE
jgi:ketosteroid isomerase-like protein